MENSTKSFVKGALFGALAGAAAGILFAPKSGKETREDIKDAANQLKEKATDLYMKAKASVDKKVSELKKAGQQIDKKSYENIINEVVDELKNNRELTADAGKKLGDQLKSDWNEVKAALQA